ncbi:GMP synthase [Mycobacteroides abscessus subsp. massiliense]|nr:GMP synthase [Mycobacteroides abscessus subsp. massiliense]
MMENVEKQFYGIQFHPEVTHTKQGRALLNRFVLDICGAQPSWTMPNYIEEAVAKIREQVGSDEVILTDLRVRRSRPLAPERRQNGDGYVCPQLGRTRDSR